MCALLELFSTTLADVRFGDIDAEALGRLDAAAKSAATEVAQRLVAYEDAKAKLEEQHDELLSHAHRALAYARVYAEGDPTLTARLEAIALPRRARSVEAPIRLGEPATRQRRRRKTQSTAPLLDSLEEEVTNHSAGNGAV